MFNVNENLFISLKGKTEYDIREEVMLKFLLTTVILIIASTLAYGQAPVVEWETVIGANGGDNVINIYQLQDGGYILGGMTQYFGGRNQDNFFVRLNADGDTLWTKAWGDYSYAENVSEFIPTSDGGYLTIGNKTTSPYPAQFFMLKLDEDCDSVWTAIHGNPDYQKGACGVVEAYDGGYLFTGQYGQDEYGRQLFIIKTNSSGTILWERFYGLDGTDTGYCIIKADSGNYMITGQSPSFNNQQWNSDLFLMKINSAGDSIWTRSYGGDQEDRGTRVRRTADGGYIAAGYAKSFSGGYYKDWYIVRTDANGDSLWTRVYGNPYEDVAMDVKVLPGNAGFVVVGSIHYGQWDGCLLRLDANGDSLWAVAVGGMGYEIFNAVERTADGGYIVAGQTDSYGAGGTDIYVVKFSPDPLGIDYQNGSGPAIFSLSQNYPNPFNARTTIEYGLPEAGHVKIEVYDLLGRRVATLLDEIKQAGYHQEAWDASDNSSGVYFYRLEMGDFSETKRMILIK